MYAIRSYYENRIQRGGEAVRDIVGKVWMYVVAGIAVGAFIHGYVPQDFMASIMGNRITSYNVCYTKLLRSRSQASIDQ